MLDRSCFQWPANLAYVAILSTGSAVMAGDWSQWRGDARNGVDENSPPLIESLPTEGLPPQWVSEPIKSQKEGGFSSPVIVDGKVYVFAHVREQLEKLGPAQYPYLAPDKRTGMSDEDFAAYEQKRREEAEQRARAYAFREIVYCLDADSGETLWKNMRDSVYTRWPQSGSPVVSGGRLYVLGGARIMRCVDVVTGQDIWSTPLPGEFRDEFWQASPALVSGVIVVMADHLFGLSADEGRILWEGDPKSTRGSHSSPVVWETAGQGLVIVNVAGGQTACIDPTDGRELWRVKTDGGQSTPVIVGDRLITYGRSRKSGVRCFRLSLTAAEEQWVFQRVQDKGSSPVVVDGHVYVQGERRLACVNLETGEAAWQTSLNLPSPQYTSLVAADRKVFYAYEGLIAFAATPADYVPLIEAKFNASGLMATEAAFREKLNLAEIERQPDGLEKSLRLMQKETGRQGPLRTTSPAIAGGRLFVRTKDALACYDLRANSN